MEANTSWTVVSKKRRPVTIYDTEGETYLLNEDNRPMYQDDKISDPCWFYNNGGCRHKDGSEKTAEECKYLHTYSDNVKRPPHLSTRKPCDKFNLEGECRWYENCKYSHRNLSVEECSRFYPGIPYTLKTNVQKRIELENKLADIEGRMRVMEFKQDGISRDVQQIGNRLRELMRQFQH